MKINIMKFKRQIIFEYSKSGMRTNFDVMGDFNRNKININVFLNDGTRLYDKDIKDISIKIAEDFEKEQEKAEREKDYKVQATYTYGDRKEVTTRKFPDRQALQEFVQTTGASLNIIDVKDLIKKVCRNCGHHQEGEETFCPVCHCEYVDCEVR